MSCTRYTDTLFQASLMLSPYTRSVLTSRRMTYVIDDLMRRVWRNEHAVTLVLVDDNWAA